MTPETALKHQFSLNKSFSEEEYLSITSEDEALRAKDQMLTYLGIRPHSRHELFLKSMKKGYTEKAINEAIAALERVDLIDDQAFTKAFVQNEIRLRPCGRRLMAERLRQKGVMAALFEEIIEDAYLKNPPKDLIRQLLEKQLRRHQNTAIEKKREKIIRFLLSRGFEWEQIRDVMEGILPEKNDD